MEGWVDLGGWLHAEMVYLPQAVTHRSTNHRCDKRLQHLQKNLCKRVYYFVNVYLNKNHMSETKQNYDRTKIINGQDNST